VAARIHERIAGPIKLRNTRPPLASNDLLCDSRPSSLSKWINQPNLGRDYIEEKREAQHEWSEHKFHPKDLPLSQVPHRAFLFCVGNSIVLTGENANHSAQYS
jgi:hypothetical protein